MNNLAERVLNVGIPTTAKEKEGFLFAPIKPVTWLIVYANQAIYI